MARSHSMRDYPAQAVALGGAAMLAGALGAVLFTPRRGSEIRYLMKRRGIAMKDKLKLATYEVADSAEKSATAATKVAQASTSRAKSTVDKIKNDAKQTGHEAAKAARTTKKNTEDVTDHIRRNGEP